MTDDDKTLQDSFIPGSADKTPQDYQAAPDEATALITSLRRLLAGSATATRLIQMADSNGVRVRVLRGRDESVYVPEARWVFMAITPKTVATPRLALQYAGALREVEQNILGFTRPGVEADDDSWVTQNAVKNVDVIRHMCQIAQEISQQNQGDTVFLDSLTDLGHYELYKAFVNKSSDEDLLRLYAKLANIKTKN